MKIRKSIFTPFQILRLFYKNVMCGFQAYSRILEECEEIGIEKLYFMDYHGSGDTYLACSDLKAHDKIGPDTAFIGPKGTATKIAGLFGFRKIVKITKEDALKICDMDRFCGSQLKLIPLLYESFATEYLGILRRMGGYNGLDFMSMLRIGFERNCKMPFNEIPLVHPDFHSKDSEIDAIFTKYKLIPGKTVLISPYTANLRWNYFSTFFEKLAMELKRMGYCVCTNTTGSSSEPAIPGTCSLLVPYHLMSKFCEYAGVFIGIRSGLADIISGTKNCKKIILYPKENTSISEYSWIEFFSLNRMKLCDDAIEFEVGEDNKGHIIQLIQQNLIQNPLSNSLMDMSHEIEIKTVKSHLPKTYDIGLIGNFCCLNYGEQLSYYALYSFLKEVGYTVSIIDPNTKIQKSEIIDSLSIFDQMPYKNDEIADIYSLDCLSKINESCKMFVIGTNIVFNSNLQKIFGASFTLDWIHSNKSLICYDISFDYKFPEIEKEYAWLARQFSKIDAISVRKQSNVNLIKDTFALSNVEHTLSSVFLFDKNIFTNFAKHLEEQIPIEPYIYGYLLLSEETKSIMGFLSEHFGCIQRIVPNLSSPELEGITKPYNEYTDKNISIEKWIWLFKNANFIVTDSFYGICLSIIFHKNFFAFISRSNNNLDILDFLYRVGLQDRVFSSFEDVKLNIDSLKPIDWFHVDEILQKELIQSQKWLQTAIESNMNKNIMYSDYDILVKQNYDNFDILKNEINKNKMETDLLNAEIFRLKEINNRRFQCRLKRKIQRGLNCYRDHGFLYTLDKFLIFTGKKIFGIRQ